MKTESLFLTTWQAVIVNTLLVLTCILVALFTPNPWLMIITVLVIALIVRCVTIYLMSRRIPKEQLPEGFTFHLAIWHSAAGLILWGIAITALWGLSHLWPTVAAWIVYAIAVNVVWNMTFPFPPKAVAKAE